MTALVGGSPDAVAIFDTVYGRELRRVMVRGLGRLATAFPEVRDPGTRLIGPTLEGVGWYPMVDGDLRLLDTPAGVAGDACGPFRGIIAAMISGHYAGALLFGPDGSILLAHRIKNREPPTWCLPGGHLEPGETPERAAVREIAEEAGPHDPPTPLFPASRALLDAWPAPPGWAVYPAGAPL